MSSPIDEVPLSYFTSLIRAISELPIGGKKSPSHLFKKWAANMRKQFVLPDGTFNIIFYLLFPDKDTRRRYHMQEATIINQIANRFGHKAQLASWNDREDGFGKPGCLGIEVEKVFRQISSKHDYERSPMSIHQLSGLLDQLASLSSFSEDSIRANKSSLRQQEIIHRIYFDLNPFDAKCVTQIILKDLKPVLYPIPENHMHYTSALREGRSNELLELEIYDVLTIWDPSETLYRASRLVGFTLAIEAFESGWTINRPIPGNFVAMPKSIKGRSCQLALKTYASSPHLYAEMKYDGERAQIHLVSHQGREPGIQIFSKSRRDSTQDRTGIHKMIFDSLVRPVDSVILDAEIVPVNGLRIDEFWHMRRLIETTAVGPRGRKYTFANESQVESHQWLTSQLSSEHHLGLVYFDILYLNGQSMVSKPYSQRREALESLIKPIPGYVMVSERQEVHRTDDDLQNRAELRRIFATAVASGAEGLVLKASDGYYAGGRQSSWTKMKKDYIPGLGDSLDLAVLGACWGKERGTQLRVPSDTWTTFYLGVLRNPDDIKLNENSRANFDIYFCVEYLPDRDALEKINFVLKNSRWVSPKDSRHLPYDYTLFKDLKAPTVFFHEPLLAEVYGDRFQKKEHYGRYELRHPRVTKFHRPEERDWRKCISEKKLLKIALEALCIETEDKECEDWAKQVFGVPPSPGVNSTPKRRAREKEVGTILARADNDHEKPRTLRNFNGNGPGERFRTTLDFDHRSVSMSTIPGKSVSIPISNHSLPFAFTLQKHHSMSSIPLPTPPTSLTVHHSTTSFWNGAIVYVPRSPTSRALQKVRKGIPSEYRMHTLPALLAGCGLLKLGEYKVSPSCWTCGVVFVDLMSHPQQLNDVHESIRSRIDSPNREDILPLWVVDCALSKWSGMEDEDTITKSAIAGVHSTGICWGFK